MKKLTYEILYELYWDIRNNHYKSQQDGWMKVKDFKGIRCTENMKPEALEEIRKKLKMPLKLKYELLEGISKDKKLNDFILN